MKDVFVFIFMGQSNMAGQGVIFLAPEVPTGWGNVTRISRPINTMFQALI
jgi:hypothetical protein